MLTRTGATLVAMAAVEAETLGWQKQGGVPQKALAEDAVSPHRPRSLLTRHLLRLGHRGSQVSLLLNRSTHTREEQAGGPRQPKPTPTSSRPTSFATHWRCPRCGGESDSQTCLSWSDDPRQSAHETSTSATSSWTTPATSSTGPTSSTAPGTPPTASPPAGGAGIPKKAPPTAKSATRRQKQPVAHVVVTGSGSLLVNTAGMLTRKTRRLVLPDGRIHSPLASNFGVMPMQACKKPSWQSSKPDPTCCRRQPH